MTWDESVPGGSPSVDTTLGEPRLGHTHHSESATPLGGTPPTVTVIGSLNMDVVIGVDRLPVAGETVPGGPLQLNPGGKGGNQAVALARLGAQVRMVGCVGDDRYGRDLIRSLAAEGVDTSHIRTSAVSTGTAYVLVDPSGENQIVVSAGANSLVQIDDGALTHSDAILCQLEIPQRLVEQVAQSTNGYFALNAAPARQLSAALIERADLIIVNETEHAVIEGLDRSQLLALTLGARGAVLMRRGEIVARSGSPKVRAVDTVAAGDAFCAALVLGLVSGVEPRRALERACVAGSIAASRAGAQSSLPSRTELVTW